MLPYFAAAGHTLYAKCAYVYLQTMIQLQALHPDVHQKIDGGYHVVRRSDRYWAGLSTDLIIEQVLMRSVKTSGSLTRGKGMTDSTIGVGPIHASMCKYQRGHAKVQQCFIRNQ
ncbi:MAG: hypothetical protein DSY80_04110 [Desulfocapsa sp.]|nr:MAG: hypothetical protein DSY80_04110 [Desulfocapsa sp.]